MIKRRTCFGNPVFLKCDRESTCELREQRASRELQMSPLRGNCDRRSNSFAFHLDPRVYLRQGCGTGLSVFAVLGPRNYCQVKDEAFIHHRGFGFVKDQQLLSQGLSNLLHLQKL